MTAPLSLLPVSAVAFALGVCSTRPGQKPGQVSTLIGELKRRGVWPDLCAALDPQIVANLTLMESVDRGRARRR